MVSMMAHRAAHCLCRCQCTVECRAFLAEPSAKPTERVNSQASFSPLVGLHQILGDFVLAVQVRARDSARNTRLVVQGVGLPKAPAPETIMSNCSIHYSVYKSIEITDVILFAPVVHSASDMYKIISVCFHPGQDRTCP